VCSVYNMVLTTYEKVVELLYAARGEQAAPPEPPAAALQPPVKQRRLTDRSLAQLAARVKQEHSEVHYSASQVAYPVQPASGSEEEIFTEDEGEEEEEEFLQDDMVEDLEDHVYTSSTAPSRWAPAASSTGPVSVRKVLQAMPKVRAHTPSLHEAHRKAAQEAQEAGVAAKMLAKKADQLRRVLHSTQKAQVQVARQSTVRLVARSALGYQATSLDEHRRLQRVALGPVQPDNSPPHQDQHQDRAMLRPVPLDLPPPPPMPPQHWDRQHQEAEGEEAVAPENDVYDAGDESWLEASKCIMSLLRYGKHRTKKLLQPPSGWTSVTDLAVASQLFESEVLAIVAGALNRAGLPRYVVEEHGDPSIMFIRPVFFEPAKFRK
jgi:hypothetical protein